MEILHDSAAVEDYRFVPLDGSGLDLDLLELFAEESKVSVSGPSYPLVLRKYGSEQELFDIFEEHVGYMKEAEMVARNVKEVAEQFLGVFRREMVIVLDKRDGGLMAYALPYVGISGGLRQHGIPDELTERLKEQLQARGIEKSRIAEINTKRGDLRDIIAVFLGKA